MGYLMRVLQLKVTELFFRNDFAVEHKAKKTPEHNMVNAESRMTKIHTENAAAYLFVNSENSIN